MQPGSERLLEAHEQIPRPELAAVRVPRELQIEAGGGRRSRGAWLMGEQYLRPRIGRRTPKRGDRVTALLWIEMVRAVVGHARDDQWRPSDRKSTRLNSSHCVTSRMPSSA